MGRGGRERGREGMVLRGKERGREGKRIGKGGRYGWEEKRCRLGKREGRDGENTAEMVKEGRRDGERGVIYEKEEGWWERKASHPR